MDPEINCVGDGQEAKQAEILERLTFATVPGFADVLTHIGRIIGGMSGPRQDAGRIREMLLKSSALSVRNPPRRLLCRQYRFSCIVVALEFRLGYWRFAKAPILALRAINNWDC